MPEVITSPSNPKVKQLLALQQKSSVRRERGLFVVEGRRELQHCIDAGFIIDTIFVCPTLSETAPLHGGSPLPDFASLIPPLRFAGGPPVHEATGGHGPAGESPRSAAPAAEAETAAASPARSQQAGLFSNPRSPLLGGTFPSGQLRKREGPAADKSASADRPGPETLHFAKSERDLRATGGSGDMPPYSMGWGPATPDVGRGWLPRSEAQPVRRLRNR